jgi:hypothetical protein
MLAGGRTMISLTSTSAAARPQNRIARPTAFGEIAIFGTRAASPGLSPECDGDSAGADRSKFHAHLLSFEKSMRTTALVDGCRSQLLYRHAFERQRSR